MIGKEDGKIPEAITRYIVALYWQSPLLHFESSAFAFFPNDKGPTEGSETSQKPAKRKLSFSLSLPCLFPHPLTRTPTPTPIPISTTTTATATASAAGTTVSFPDCFRTAQAYFAPKFEIECVHAWILTLITRPSTTLSTTTTPPATAPPLPLVHLGISAFAFKSNWHESRWRVRSQSETSQKPVRNRPNATICSPPSLSPSLSLSFSLSLPLPFFPCPATRTPTPIPTPTPTPPTPPTTTTATTPTLTPTPTTGITVSFPEGGSGNVREERCKFPRALSCKVVCARVVPPTRVRAVRNRSEIIYSFLVWVLYAPPYTFIQISHRWIQVVPATRVRAVRNRSEIIYSFLVWVLYAPPYTFIQISHRCIQVVPPTRVRAVRNRSEFIYSFLVWVLYSMLHHTLSSNLAIGVYRLCRRPECARSGIGPKSYIPF